MLNVIDEGFYLKNGEKSAVHCIKQITYNSGILSKIHYHNYIEILYGICCNATIWISDKTYIFETGDICIINPKETHRVFSDREFNEYFVIKFSPEILYKGGNINSEIKYILSLLRKDEKINPIIKKDNLDENKIKEIVDTLFSEWEKEDAGYEFIIKGKIINLFGEIVRILNKDNYFTEYINTNNQNDIIIHSIADYITDNYLNVSEKDMAEKSNMSYAHFSKCFKKVMNKNFSQFLNEIKTDAAKRILLTENKNVTEIAMELGYSSTSHFIQNFKKNTGETPLSYKKKRSN